MSNFISIVILLIMIFKTQNVYIKFVNNPWKLICINKKYVRYSISSLLNGVGIKTKALSVLGQALYNTKLYS